MKNKLKIITTLFILFFVISGVSAETSAYPSGSDDREITSALDFLKTCQYDDGGFGEEGRGSNPGTSTWVILAIAAAGENPKDWVVNGTSAMDYLNNLTEETLAIDGTSETAKMILTVVAVGKDPRNFEGTDFVSLLKKKEKPDGQYSDFIYTTNWAIIAMSAAGEDTKKSVEWLKTQQNEDGGFGWMPGAESDSDDTASALEALIAGGEPANSPTVRKTLSYLHNAQMNDGGFSYGGSSGSNAASAAWVIQAITAAGENPTEWTKNGINVVSQMLSYQQPSGYFMWTDMLTDNPCRMTASAIPALLGRPYPIIPGQESPIVSSRASDTGTIPPTVTVTPVQTETPDESIPAETETDRTETTITVIDDFGYKTTIHGIPQRIISLAPSNTEILFALGLGDKVVGVTDYCNYPAEAEKINKVGGYSTVNTEKVIAASPDLIIASFGNTEEAATQLRKMGFTVIALNPETLHDVIENIRLVGRATGTETRASEVADGMQEQINAITKRSKEAKNRPSVAHIVWYDPIWVSGNHTFQNEMFEMAGGENAFPDVNGWEIVSLEKFITKDPDILIVNTGSGMGESGKDIIYEHIINEARFQNLEAVKNKRVYLIDSDIIDRGGPRLIDALEITASYIHPEIYNSPAQEKTTVPAMSSPGFGLVTFVALVSLIIGIYLVDPTQLKLRRR